MRVQVQDEVDVCTKGHLSSILFPSALPISHSSRLEMSLAALRPLQLKRPLRGGLPALTAWINLQSREMKNNMGWNRGKHCFPFILPSRKQTQPRGPLTHAYAVSEARLTAQIPA